MTTNPASNPATGPTDEATPADAVTYDTPRRLLTVPNVLTVLRMLGSGVLVWLAAAGFVLAFVILFVVLVLTDWLDGKIAVYFHQRSELGARLDSFADAILYTCLLIGTAWARPEFVRSDAFLIVGMLCSYAVPVIATLVRFNRLPAYHTRAAKTLWFLASCAAIVLLLDGPVWPARVVMAGVILANVEALAIALVLREWQADIPSILHALRRRRRVKTE